MNICKCGVHLFYLISLSLITERGKLIKVAKVKFRVILKMTEHPKKCPKLFSQLKCASKRKRQKREKGRWGKRAKGGA